MIAKITAAIVGRHADTKQIFARVVWQDTTGAVGTTEGEPLNLHMQELLARAEREGVRITRGLEQSNFKLMHYPATTAA